MNASPSVAVPVTGPVTRPSIGLFGTEPFRAAMEFLSHKLTYKEPSREGDGHPVMIFPGLGSDGRAMAPLREYCQSLGYTALDWGRGFNKGPQGDVEAWLADLAEDVREQLAEHPQPATLIGWSLGGIYAREVGKILAPRVRQVITIGTPFNAEADHTNVGWLFRLLSGSPATIAPQVSKRLRTPPTVPTTSIYSKTDGVVAWQTCRHDKPPRHVQDIEIAGSHIGMGWNSSALKVVADRLAQPVGGWRPFFG
jgi:hypothetical protein